MTVTTISKFVRVAQPKSQGVNNRWRARPSEDDEREVRRGFGNMRGKCGHTRGIGARLCECSVWQHKAGFRRGRHSIRSKGSRGSGSGHLGSARTVLSLLHICAFCYSVASRACVSQRSATGFLLFLLWRRRYFFSSFVSSFLLLLLLLLFLRSSFDTCRRPIPAEVRY